VARADGLVELGAEDRVQATLHRRAMELDETEQNTVIRDRDTGLPVPRDRIEQVIDSRGTIEHRVLGVHVKVDETTSGAPLAPYPDV
jgi:hypothetical protein